MHLKNLTAQAALQLIGRFRQGRNIIFGAEIFSVGRQEWLRGADQVFQDIEHTGDSMVRFIRGSYGVGKTNFAARLFHSALKRGWVGAYIELSDKVKLHEFHQVFAEITQMLYQPKQINNGASSSATPVGLIGIFDDYYHTLRRAIGLTPGADIPASARSDLLARVNTVLQNGRIYGDFANALRAYFQSRLEDDTSTIDLLKRWFRADQDVRIPALGVMRPISKISGKEHLRAVSSFLLGLGYRGLLVIMDELEQVMEETPARRRKAYTILRELIDNVDGENGMKSTCLYAAAPPGQFESQKGFIEVEALASRIQTPIVLGSGITDYMGTIINLDSAPLSEDERTELAKRLRAIHSIARSWDASKVVADAELLRIVREIAAKRQYSTVRIRDFCVEFTAYLETLHAAS